MDFKSKPFRCYTFLTQRRKGAKRNMVTQCYTNKRLNCPEIYLLSLCIFELEKKVLQQTLYLNRNVISLNFLRDFQSL